MTDNANAIRTEVTRPSPEIVKGYGDLSTTALSDFLALDNVMRHAIHPLWGPSPRIAGPAFTVRTPKHDNLMMHAAIYLAQPGDIIVVEAGDEEMAVAGGNVCAIAQRRGVAGFVIDGTIRDVRPTGRSIPGRRSPSTRRPSGSWHRRQRAPAARWFRRLLR